MSRSERTAWALALLWVLVYAGGVALLADAPRPRRILGLYVYDLVPLLAAVLVLRRWRRERTRFWALAAGAVGASALGDVLWTLAAATGRGRAPFPSPADVAYAVALAVAAAALLGRCRGLPAVRWARGALDGLLTGTATAALLWPVLEGRDGSLLLALAYPVLIAAVAGLWLSVGLAGHRGVPRPVLVLGLAFTLRTGSTVGFLAAEAGGGFLPGGWTDVPFQAGAAVYAVAALVPATPDQRERPVRADRELGLYALLVGAVPVVVAVLVRGWDGQLARPDLWLLAVAVLALALRMLLSNRDARRVAVDLEHALDGHARLARTDPLTGLQNRRGLQESLLQALAVGVRSGAPVGLVLLDVDHFKRVNDQHGHAVGDQALQHLAHLLLELVRPGDLVARWGGEEFLLLLPDAAERDVVALAERVRRAVAARPLSLDGRGELRLTVSAGATSAGPPTGPQEALQAADQALYAAKERGRDRVSYAAAALQR